MPSMSSINPQASEKGRAKRIARRPPARLAGILERYREVAITDPAADQ